MSGKVTINQIREAFSELLDPPHDLGLSDLRADPSPPHLLGNTALRFLIDNSVLLDPLITKVLEDINRAPMDATALHTIPRVLNTLEALLESSPGATGTPLLEEQHGQVAAHNLAAYFYPLSPGTLAHYSPAPAQAILAKTNLNLRWSTGGTGRSVQRDARICLPGSPADTIKTLYTGDDIDDLLQSMADRPTNVQAIYDRLLACKAVGHVSTTTVNLETVYEEGLCQARELSRASIQKSLEELLKREIKPPGDPRVKTVDILGSIALERVLHNFDDSEMGYIAEGALRANWLYPPLADYYLNKLGPVLRLIK